MMGPNQNDASWQQKFDQATTEKVVALRERNDLRAQVTMLRLALEMAANTDCYDPYCEAVQIAEAAFWASCSDDKTEG